MADRDEFLEFHQPEAERRRQEDEHLRDNLREAQRLGTRLNLSSTPFTVSADQVANAIITGPRRYMIRLRRIELGVERLLAAARTAWLDLAEEHRGSPARFARAWQAWVRSVDVANLNALIEVHNEWYPVEANLPMDVRTGNYITRDGRDYREEVITPAWLLERFPADLGQAQAAAQAQAEAAGQAGS